MSGLELAPQNYNTKASGFTLCCITQDFFFQKIFYSTGSTKARRYPLSYIYSGLYYYKTSKLDSQGTYARLWSNSGVDNTTAHAMDIGASLLITEHYDYRYNAVALRCVVQNSFHKS